MFCFKEFPIFWNIVLNMFPEILELIAILGDGTSLGYFTGQLTEHCIGWIKRCIFNTSNANDTYLLSMMKKMDRNCIGMMAYDLVDLSQINDYNEKIEQKLWQHNETVTEYNNYKNLLPDRCKYWLVKVDEIKKCGDPIDVELTNALAKEDDHSEIINENDEENINQLQNPEHLLPQPLTVQEHEQLNRRREQHRQSERWINLFEHNEQNDDISVINNINDDSGEYNELIEQESAMFYDDIDPMQFGNYNEDVIIPDNSDINIVTQVDDPYRIDRRDSSEEDNKMDEFPF